MLIYRLGPFLTSLCAHPENQYILCCREFASWLMLQVDWAKLPLEILFESWRSTYWMHWFTKQVQCIQIIPKNWKIPLFILLKTRRNSGLSLWAIKNLSSPTSYLGLKLLTLAKACSNQDWLCRSCLLSKFASGFLAKDQSNGVLELSYLKTKTTKLIMVV